MISRFESKGLRARKGQKMARKKAALIRLRKKQKREKKVKMRKIKQLRSESQETCRTKILFYAFTISLLNSITVKQLDSNLCG